jgi:dienelactone hydrolase
LENSTTSIGAHRQKSWPKRLAVVLSVLAAILVAAVLAFLIYASDYYHALDSNEVYETSTTEVMVEHESNYLSFGPSAAEHALLFYPGAKVEYLSYAPLMHEIAQDGYLCIVVEMPFNLAILDVNAADSIMARYPDVKNWWIGGHSLGGLSASHYASQNASKLDGLVLLGSYSIDDLSDTELSVVSIYGSNDTILTYDMVVSGRELMPTQYKEQIIEGGNHAYFGNYGDQEGDGKANITPDEQWNMTADIVSDEMAKSY